MDPLFSPGDLAEMRAVNDANLPNEVIVTTLARQRQAGGGIVEMATAAAPIPCRLSAGSPSQNAAMTAEQLQSISRWTLVVSASAPGIPFNAKVHITGELDDGTPWVKDLTVVGIHGPKAYEVLRKYTCVDPQASGR